MLRTRHRVATYAITSAGLSEVAIHQRPTPAAAVALAEEKLGRDIVGAVAYTATLDDEDQEREVAVLARLGLTPATAAVVGPC